MERSFIVHLEAGKRAIESSNFEKAYTELSRAIYLIEDEQSPDEVEPETLAEIYALRALALFATDEAATKSEPEIFNQVMDDWDHAIDLSPGRVGYRNLRAQLYLDCTFTDYTQEAIDEVEQVLKQLEHQKDALRLAGDAYKKKKQYDKALYHYGLSLEQEMSADVLLSRAQVFVEMLPPQYDLGIKDLQQAKQIDPENESLYLYRAEILDAMEEQEAMVDEYDQLIDFSPKAAHYLLRGNAYLATGALDQAKADYDQAISLEKIADALNNRGWIYAQQGEFQRGLKDVQAALVADANCRIAYATLAEIYALKGDKDQFFKHLDLALEHYYTDYLDVLEEPAFEAYRDDPRFGEIITHHKNSQFDTNKIEESE